MQKNNTDTLVVNEMEEFTEIEVKPTQPGRLRRAGQAVVNLGKKTVGAVAAVGNGVVATAKWLGALVAVTPAFFLYVVENSGSKFFNFVLRRQAIDSAQNAYENQYWTTRLFYNLLAALGFGVSWRKKITGVDEAGQAKADVTVEVAAPQASSSTASVVANLDKQASLNEEAAVSAEVVEAAKAANSATAQAKVVSAPAEVAEKAKTTPTVVGTHSTAFRRKKKAANATSLDASAVIESDPSIDERSASRSPSPRITSTAEM